MPLRSRVVLQSILLATTCAALKFPPLSSLVCAWNPIACYSSYPTFLRTGLLKTSKPVKMSEPAALKFPANFMWGTATASYQIEGGVDARGSTIWDDFAAKPGKVANGDNGSVACDHYHRYKGDVELMASLGTKYYRFSIAWARLFPAKNVTTPAVEGVLFYKGLLEELKRHGITPVATLYHWDLPSWVQKETGGWAGDGSVADRFQHYARTCFNLFGETVKMWITLNEPWCSALLGYEVGEHAPGDTSGPGRKVYIAAHHLLRAHAKAVDVYRAEFQDAQKGKIGITLNADWAQPKGPDGPAASARDMEFSLGWFADPVHFGDYPKSMKDTAGARLPSFTDAEKKSLKGSSDFFGLNHYSTHYSTGVRPAGGEVNYWNDKLTIDDHDKKWAKTDMGWSVVPAGFGALLEYITKKYKPEGGIIVTENGLAAKEPNLAAAMKDESRISFYSRYIGAMHQAIQNGADVRGYFLWSFMDNFEWAFGYEKRFGLFYVDYKTQQRMAKPAVKWYRNVVESNSVDVTWKPEDIRF